MCRLVRRPPPFDPKLLDMSGEESSTDEILFELERRLGRELVPAVQRALAIATAQQGGASRLDGVAAHTEIMDEYVCVRGAAPAC